MTLEGEGSTVGLKHAFGWFFFLEYGRLGTIQSVTATWWSPVCYLRGKGQFPSFCCVRPAVGAWPCAGTVPRLGFILSLVVWGGVTECRD